MGFAEAALPQSVATSSLAHSPVFELHSSLPNSHGVLKSVSQGQLPSAKQNVFATQLSAPHWHFSELRSLPNLFVQLGKGRHVSLVMLMCLLCEISQNKPVVSELSQSMAPHMQAASFSDVPSVFWQGVAGREQLLFFALHNMPVPALPLPLLVQTWLPQRHSSFGSLYVDPSTFAHVVNSTVHMHVMPGAVQDMCNESPHSRDACELPVVLAVFKNSESVLKHPRGP